MFQKLTLLLGGICLFLLINIGCKNNSEISSTTSSEESLPSKSDFLQKKLPQLYQLIGNKSAFKQAVNDYAYNVLNADKLITAEQPLMDLFKQREEEIQPELHEFFQNLSGQKPDLFNSEEGEKLIAELKSIGFTGIFAEGMYVYLGTAPIMVNQLKTLASEPFRLCIEFSDAEAEAWQGEYPYLDLTGEKKMVAIGEQILFKYPETEYAPKIREFFYMALNVLTDVRAMKNQNDLSFLTGGGLTLDPYPFATDIEQIKSFATEYPQSRYAKVVQKITQDFSEITIDAELPLPIYLVWIQEVTVNSSAQQEDWDGCRTPAQKIKNVFLNKGIDIPHIVTVYQNNVETCGVVYRFYSDKSKAELAVKNLQSMAPDVKATMKKAVFNSSENRWDIE